MVEDLLEISAKFSNISLVIKEHPLDTRLDKKRYSELQDGKIIITQYDMPIQNLIGLADVYITFFSATTFDAIYQNKATVNLIYKDSVCDNLFELSNVSFIAKNKNDIEYVFRLTELGKHNELMSEIVESRKKFFEGWYDQSHTSATQKIAQIALKMVR